jgi:hypothetical protein
MAYGRSTDGAWYQKSIPIFNQFSTVAYKQRSPDYSNSPAQSTVCCLLYGLRANHVLSVYQEGTRDVFSRIAISIGSIRSLLIIYTLLKLWHSLGAFDEQPHCSPNSCAAARSCRPQLRVHTNNVFNAKTKRLSLPVHIQRPSLVVTRPTAFMNHRPPSLYLKNRWSTF